MKRQRTSKGGKVNVAKRQKQFAGARPKVGAGAGYQASRAMVVQPKQELKAFDNPTVTIASSTIAAPPTFQTINTMVNGAELYQRVGRKVYMKSLHFRAYFGPNAASLESYNRLIIYYDANPNGADNLIGDLIRDSTAGAAVTDKSELNLFNRERFQILRDYPIIGGTSTGLGAGATEIVPDPIKSSYNIDFFIPLKGLEAVYNAVNGGTIADIQAGALKWVIFGDANAGAYSLTAHSRIRYYD